MGKIADQTEVRVNRLPKPIFRTLEQLDRTRSMMLALPVRKWAKEVPFGYEIVEGEDLLQPVELEFAALYKAREYLEYSSYKEVAKWIANETGRKISDAGLYKILQNRPPLDEVFQYTREERERF